MSIRVMHVAECAGGVDRYLRGLLKYIDHETFENVLVLSKQYEGRGYEELSQDVEIIDIPHGMGIKTLISAVNIRKQVKKHKPQVVYAHSSIAGAVTRLACIGLDCKVIYNPHGWSFNMWGNRKKVYSLLERIMAPFCDAIVCISEAEKVSALENKICKEDKLHVIYNGIDMDENEDISISRKELGIPLEAFVVGMVGRISTQKAPDVFVKMAGEIKKEIKNSLFVIVGDVIEGDIQERKRIEDLADEMGIELMITGWVNNPLDYVRTFDVACLLSRWEGFGLAIPEYMLCEKPIVATKVDAIPYLIENSHNGFLVDVDDYKAAAKAVIKLQDAELCNSLACNGLKTVKERFDVRRVADETAHLIKKLLDVN